MVCVKCPSGVWPTGAAGVIVVVVRFAVLARVASRAGGVARRALDETMQKIPASILLVGVASVLLKHCSGPLLYLQAQYRWNRLLYDILPTVRRDPVGARVGGLAADVGDGRNRPQRGTRTLLGARKGGVRDPPAREVQDLVNRLGYPETTLWVQENRHEYLEGLPQLLGRRVVPVAC